MPSLAFTKLKRCKDIILQKLQLNENEKVLEVDESFNYCAWLMFSLRSISMLPIFADCEGKNYLHVLNWCYMILVNSIIFYTCLGSYIFIVVNFEGYTFTMIFNMIANLLYLMSFSFLLYFWVYRKELLRLFRLINHTFKYRSAPGITRLDMHVCHRRSRLWGAGFVIMSIVTTLHWTIKPPITPDDDSRVLPINMWYPIDVQQSPYYELAYLIQAFAQYILALTFANYDIFMMTLGILICGQFDIVCCSLRNIRFTALLEAGHPVEDLLRLSGYDAEGGNRCTLVEDEQNQYFYREAVIMDEQLALQYDLGFIKQEKTQQNAQHSNSLVPRGDYEEETVAAIKACLKHHQDLVKLVKCLQAFNSRICFLKMLELTTVSCILIYTLNVEIRLPAVEYTLMTLWDIFIICFFGNEITLRSEAVAGAALGWQWYTLRPRVRRLLLLLIARAQEPVLLTGGYFYTLNLENFIAVLKASFSYVAVLKAVNEDEE